MACPQLDQFAATLAYSHQNEASWAIVCACCGTAQLGKVLLWCSGRWKWCPVETVRRIKGISQLIFLYLILKGHSLDHDKQNLSSAYWTETLQSTTQDVSSYLPRSSSKHPVAISLTGEIWLRKTWIGNVLCTLHRHLHEAVAPCEDECRDLVKVLGLCCTISYLREIKFVSRLLPSYLGQDAEVESEGSCKSTRSVLLLRMHICKCHHVITWASLYNSIVLWGYRGDMRFLMWFQQRSQLLRFDARMWDEHVLRMLSMKKSCYCSHGAQVQRRWWWLGMEPICTSWRHQRISKWLSSQWPGYSIESQNDCQPLLATRNRILLYYYRRLLVGKNRLCLYAESL